MCAGADSCPLFNPLMCSFLHTPWCEKREKALGRGNDSAHAWWFEKILQQEIREIIISYSEVIHGLLGKVLQGSFNWQRCLHYYIIQATFMK